MCGRCVGDVWAMYKKATRTQKMRTLSRIRTFPDWCSFIMVHMRYKTCNPCRGFACSADPSWIACACQKCAPDRQLPLSRHNGPQVSPTCLHKLQHLSRSRPFQYEFTAIESGMRVRKCDCERGCARSSIFAQLSSVRVAHHNITVAMASMHIRKCYLFSMLTCI